MDNLFVGATSPPFQLLQLPVEIVVSILGNLPWRSLLPLSLVREQNLHEIRRNPSLIFSLPVL